MTIDSCGRRVQQPTLRSMMEALVPSPARMEIIPPSEAFGSGGQEPYAASPNSLYMYEQEKTDMMNFDPVNPSVPSPSVMTQAEEFDLKPQFENSNTLDISNMTPTNYFQGGQAWRVKDVQALQAGMDTGLRTDKSEMGSEPTLNELNLDDSLLDELNLENLLQNVDTSVFASGAPSPSSDSKLASGVVTPVQENCSSHTPLMTVLGASRALDSLATQSSGQSPVSRKSYSLGATSSSSEATIPTYSGSVRVKREPYDPKFDAAEQGTLLHRLLIQGTPMSKQQQQQQLLLMTQSFTSPKSMPAPSTPPPTSAPSSSLPPLKLRGSQISASLQCAPTSSSSSSAITKPLRFKVFPSSTPVLKQEAPASSSCRFNAMGGPSSQVPPHPHPRGVKRTLSSVEEDSQNTMELKWKEIEQFIHNPESAGGAEMPGHGFQAPKKVRHASDNSNRTSSIDASSDVDSDDDDSDNDLDSDLEDSVILPSEMGESLLDDKMTGSGKKKERQYFWQYNVQAKGPKGTRLRLLIDSSNPHELHHFEDPVFDPENTMVAGIRHGGKARKGDGNEVAPNPKKFYHIGLQIRRLTRQIADLGNTNELPAPQRNAARKQKNKLASRACRLKKKAQHEANKVKLYGMEKEHRQSMFVLSKVNGLIVERAAMMMEQQQNGTVEKRPKTPMTAIVENLVKSHLTERVAGNGVEYVNSVITKVEQGDWTGGLDIPKSKG